MHSDGGQDQGLDAAAVTAEGTVWSPLAGQRAMELCENASPGKQRLPAECASPGVTVWVSSRWCGALGGGWGGEGPPLPP